MCEISKSQRRTYRDQDPPRIRDRSTENLLKDDFETSKSTPNSPTTLQRVSSLEKSCSDPVFFEKPNQLKRDDSNSVGATSSSRCQGSTSSSRGNNASSELEVENAKAWRNSAGDLSKELVQGTVPSTCGNVKEVVNTNGEKNGSDNYDGLTNEREMAPVLGVPIPPPAPHMGPDGLILPRKPYNPCLGSSSHKDLHRELLFNQRIGKNVLNQKSELQRALERHREAVSRKEADRNRDESYKDDPRTALQRAIEQRAKHIQLTEESQPTEPTNLLITARAKLRTRMDSQ